MSSVRGEGSFVAILETTDCVFEGELFDLYWDRSLKYANTLCVYSVKLILWFLVSKDCTMKLLGVGFEQGTTKLIKPTGEQYLLTDIADFSSTYTHCHILIAVFSSIICVFALSVVTAVVCWCFTFFVSWVDLM